MRFEVLYFYKQERKIYGYIFHIGDLNLKKEYYDSSIKNEIVFILIVLEMILYFLLRKD